MLSILLSTCVLVPPLSTSSLPGNVNFDPLQLASKDLTLKGLKTKRTSEDILYDYRESELKHGRLAMLASVAYPIQEVVNPILSKSLNFPNELAYGKLSPSLVNGNLSPSILIFFLGLASGLELWKMNQKTSIPCDYKWRFLNTDSDSSEFFDLQAGEVWNGRIAMIAILGYVVQEALTKTPVLFI